MNQKQLESEIRALLDQFGQVILHGPPGTGKTYAARNVAAALLRDNGDATVDIDNNDRFALVQFHPSYNYEDFVRGVQVKTDDGQVVYETVNRVFGQMAEKAASASDKAFAMVIDEINRANVSAVLGELIYALEYRGRPVKTPYAIGSGDNAADLSVPANLKIIGTMNAADRTIGQIDYAVRRRFAFVHCAPDVGIVQSVGGPRAPEFFNLVDAVFAHLSPDYDAEDVRIGHSYFLADGGELANKIIYQVVPILREYLKDGVLTKDAAGMIDEIERRAKEMGKSRGMDEQSIPRTPTAKTTKWRWVHKSGDASDQSGLPLGRMILSLVEHCAKKNSRKNLAELREDFPDERGKRLSVRGLVWRQDDGPVQKDPDGFFLDHPIKLAEDTIVVSRDLGATGKVVEDCFNRFVNRAGELGYWIRRRDGPGARFPYWYLNVGDRGNAVARFWSDCLKYGFVSGGQDERTVRQMKNVPLGAPVFAYRNEIGFVGFGVVTDAARPIAELKADGKPLLECELRSPNLDKNSDNESICEWAVKVHWWKTLADKDAVFFSQTVRGHTACTLGQPEMIRKLEKGFGIPDNSDDDPDN